MNAEYFSKGYNVPIFNPNDLFNTTYESISYLKLSSNAAKILISEIHNHFDIFMKYIPVDLFSLIYSILLDLEKIYFFLKMKISN